MKARTTNLALLLTLVITFATGVGAVASGTARGRWVVIAHGVAGLLLVALAPAKARVVRAGLRRSRPGRWFSLLLVVLVVAALGLGVSNALGAPRTVAGLDVLYLHIATALALVPLLLWHLAARRFRPRRTDVSRRSALRLGGLALAAGAIYTVSNLPWLPGARRRFTGSYERGSFDPRAMPNTIWLNDTVPAIDPSSYRLTVDGREWGLAELAARTVTRRALLDCTSGWYAEQDWTGVPLADLLAPDPSSAGRARSLVVRSRTGYWVRLPVADLPHLLLATGVGGRALSPGHGYPVRLVCPGRRGFWWVKWVERIELSDAPAWWQPPFPVT
jgi:DMSO/TMAO reductase YedYZ molybdopterin-dependent catalytic subunit